MYKIMIADDEPIVRKGLVNLVDWNNLDCEIIFQADDGALVIENLDIYNPDILICDIRMPRVDGIGVAKYIYENHLHTKMIILTGFADFSYARLAIKYNVIEYITKANALEGIPDAIKKAKEAIEKSKIATMVPDMSTLKINFLKSVIDGSLFDDDISTGFMNYDIELGTYQVISLQFLRNDRFSEIENGKFYKSISNFFTMSFSGYSIYQIPLSKEQFCIIVYRMSSIDSGTIKNVCQSLAETLEGFMQLNVIIGISSRYCKSNELVSAYQQANLFSNTFFLDHNKKVYSASEADSFSLSVDMKNLTSIIDNIALEIQKGNAIEAIGFFEELLTLQSHSSIEIIKSTGIIIINTCDKLLATYNTSTQVLTSNKHILSNIFGCTLLSQYKEIIENVIKVTTSYLNNYLQCKNKLILDTLNYINNHYHEDITLLDIANKVHVNSSYLSRSFKEHTGSTIIATLNNKKIEKAKELLLNSDLKIYEISEAVGISDTTYFSHFFKKNTGLSPKEFKENNI